MTTKLMIDRELLERIDESAICDGTDTTISDDLFTQLVAALATPRQPAVHTDDAAVDRFAAAMKAKLAKAREKGRGGWDDKAQCSQRRACLPS